MYDVIRAAELDDTGSVPGLYKYGDQRALTDPARVRALERELREDEERLREFLSVLDRAEKLGMTIDQSTIDDETIQYADIRDTVYGNKKSGDKCVSVTETPEPPPERTISQGYFDKAMADSWNEIVNDNSNCKMDLEKIPVVRQLIGQWVRQMHLDMPEFATGLNQLLDKTFFCLQNGNNRIPLGLGREVNYAKLGMYDAWVGCYPGTKMFVVKAMRGELPSTRTRAWYYYGLEYGKKRMLEMGIRDWRNMSDWLLDPNNFRR